MVWCLSLILGKIVGIITLPLSPKRLLFKSVMLFCLHKMTRFQEDTHPPRKYTGAFLCKIPWLRGKTSCKYFVVPPVLTWRWLWLGKNCQTKQLFVEACLQVVESNCGWTWLNKTTKQPHLMWLPNFGIKLFYAVHNVRERKKTSVWNINVITIDESLLFLQEKRQKSLFLGIMGFGWFWRTRN